MHAAAIIARKRDGHELNEPEIRFMIEGMTSGRVPDYQMAAWAMAVLLNGMTARETAVLTRAMLDSGTRLPRITERPRVDKHSTGGLGDKVSLILAPLLASTDLEVPMLSGRGLGITGGTLDKLESYVGFRCDLSIDEINDRLRRVGCVITGTTDEIAPADRQLYALRDVTATVPSIALITASILSKKLAETLDALVLDVKFGSGAFMKELDAASRLADSLQSTAADLGLPTRVVISNMEQPLGQMVGNACEVNEAVAVLQGEGPEDVRRLVLHLATQVYTAVHTDVSKDAAWQHLEKLLDGGQALERYIQMIEAQEGRFEPRVRVAKPHVVSSTTAGWVAAVDGEVIGNVVIELGGGRRKLGDPINHAVGIEMLCKIGDRIEVGQPLARVFTDDANAAQQATSAIQAAIAIADNPCSPVPLIIERDRIERNRTD